MLTLIFAAALAAFPQPATTADPHAGHDMQHGGGEAKDDCCDKPCCDKKSAAKADCCADMARKSTDAKPDAHQH